MLRVARLFENNARFSNAERAQRIGQCDGKVRVSLIHDFDLVILDRVVFAGDEDFGFGFDFGAGFLATGAFFGAAAFFTGALRDAAFGAASIPAVRFAGLARTLGASSLTGMSSAYPHRLSSR